MGPWPAAAIVGGTLTVACRGTGNALWETTATVPATGLPRFTKWESVNGGAGWTRAVSLGGSLIGGPGIAATSGFVEGGVGAAALN